MSQRQTLARPVFALGMIGLGVVGLIYGDFAMVWQPVPTWVPGREGLAYVSALVMLAGGIGLLVQRTAALAARVLLAYIVVWILLLKVPGIFLAPLVEAKWLGVGEIAILVAGGLVLFATLGEGGPAPRFASGDRGLRIAKIVFGLALLPIGLSHIIYAADTAALVPGWLPYRVGWAYLTGVGHIAAGLGVLFSVFPRLAAAMEAAMLSVFTLLVWGSGILAKPTDRLQWTAFTVSWAISAGAWVVAAGMTRARGKALPFSAPRSAAPTGSR